jgi:crossover junction endodeoxyribonuclease RusA
MTVTLPYPPAKLSPNARLHWRAKAKAVKSYRAECGFELLAQGVNRMPSVSLKLTFCPPDRRRRDRDNAIHAFKAGQDAIADITGIDDSQFQVTYAPGFGEPCKGGCVIVEITQ